MDGLFAAGIAMVIFGLLLILMGAILPDFLGIVLPIAAVFILGGIAFKVISVKNLP